MRRRANALGYGMRSPPARARADYFFKDHKPSALQGEARLRVTRTPTVTLSTIGYRLSAIGYRLRSALGSPGRSPPARHANSNGDPIDHRLSAIGYRLSAIGYRLSAIGYDQPSAMECEARLRGTRPPTVTLSTIGYRLSAIGYRLSAIGYRQIGRAHV